MVKNFTGATRWSQLFVSTPIIRELACWQIAFKSDLSFPTPFFRYLSCIIPRRILNTFAPNLVFDVWLKWVWIPLKRFVFHIWIIIARKNNGHFVSIQRDDSDKFFERGLRDGMQHKIAFVSGSNAICVFCVRDIVLTREKTWPLHSFAPCSLCVPVGARKVKYGQLYVLIDWLNEIRARFTPVLIICLRHFDTPSRLYALN